MPVSLKNGGWKPPLAAALCGATLASHAGMPANAQDMQNSRPAPAYLLRGSQAIQPETPNVFAEDDDQSGVPADGQVGTGDDLAEEEEAAPNLLPGQARAQRISNQGQITFPGSTTAAAPRTAPVQQGKARRAETDPFAAIGLRFGSWRANPYIEQTVGYTTNQSSAAGGKGGAFVRTDFGASLASDWSRHQASINVRGSVRRNIGSGEEAVPELDADGALRLDLVDGVSANLSAGYGYSTEALTSTTLPGTASARPGVHSLNASAGLERSGGRLELSLRGSVGRTIYEDISLDGGGTQSQADRNNTFYTLTARTGYRVSSLFTPFLEAEIGTRQYDLEKDRNGERRDSVIHGIKAGARVDAGEKLNGEIAIGWRVEDIEDGKLDDVSGLTLDGSLNWSPERDMTVSLTSSTQFQGATRAGSSGSTVQAFGITATRRVNERLELNAGAGLELTRDSGTDETGILSRMQAGLRYWLNRSVALTGTVEHERFGGTNATKAWEATSVRAGMRFQR